MQRSTYKTSIAQLVNLLHAAGVLVGAVHFRRVGFARATGGGGGLLFTGVVNVETEFDHTEDARRVRTGLLEAEARRE